MYDWVSTEPGFYEKYSYDLKTSPSKSLSSLPPTQPRKSTLDKSKSVQRRQTLKSISRFIGQDSSKKQSVTSKKSSIIYQNQPMLFTDINTVDPNSYEIHYQTEYYVPLDQTFELVPQKEVPSYYTTEPHEIKENLIYYISNPDDYGNEINKNSIFPWKLELKYSYF